MRRYIMPTVLLAAVLSGGQVHTYAQRVYTLEEIFECAEQQSAMLQPSMTAIEEAREALEAAKAEKLPQIGAVLSAGYLGDGFTTKRDFSDFQPAPNPHLQNSFNVSISQPLYAGGAIRSGIEMAALQRNAAELSAETSRDNIRLALAGYYLDLYRYDNQRSVVEANIEAARKVLEEMQARYGQGTVLHNDITRYELLVSGLELQKIKIDNILRILNGCLVTTAGLPEGTLVEPDRTILDRAMPLQDEKWWQEEASSNSPAMGLARNGVDISIRAEELAKSARRPRIALQAGWVTEGPIVVEVPPIDRNLNYWFVGLGISYDFSSLFKDNRKVAQARTASRRAREELTAAGQNLGLAVREDYIHYLEAFEELKTMEKSVELAEKNYRTVLAGYSAGTALITELLDASNEKLDAAMGLVNARIGIISRYYKLLHTSGKI